MQPIDAYKDTAQRARRFCVLYSGLTNRRTRGIREDWGQSFCRFMRWRLDSSIERVDSADALIVLRQDASLQAGDFSKEALDDLLRAALVYGTSALDRYVHERVVKGIVAALKAGSLTKQQKEFSIPASDAMKIMRSVTRARRGARQVRPSNEVRKIIQDLLHERPLQSWREIDYAFNLLGITDLARQVQAAWRAASIDPIKVQLRKVVYRRNSIVHEGDLLRHRRGGHVRTQEISPSFVSNSLDFLDKCVGCLERVS
jgi:hypothetical protein